MAQRINISIPDELHAELEKWREQLNVSGVCQEALRKEVARLGAVATTSDDLDAVVTRLRAEKDEWEKHWYEIGVQLGYEWARRARYRDLLEWQDASVDGPADALAEMLIPETSRLTIGGVMIHRRLDEGDISRELADRALDVYPAVRFVLDPQSVSEESIRLREYNRQKLNEGWLKGVRDFWNQIKDAL